MDREELKRLTKEEMGRRIREGVKAVIEQVLEKEMTEHLAAGYEGTPSRRGEQNGYSTRDLITPAGRIAQLRVPRDREGTFLAEVFARYKRTRVVGIFPGEGSLVNLAKGHGGLGFPALPGHGPALGRGRETHKNRDLTPLSR
jgi:transposase-like protein